MALLACVVIGILLICFIANIGSMFEPSSSNIEQAKYISQVAGFDIPAGRIMIFYNSHDNWLGDGTKIIKFKAIGDIGDALHKMESGKNGFKCDDKIPDDFVSIYERLSTTTSINLTVPTGATCWLLLLRHDYENQHGGISQEYKPSNDYASFSSDAQLIIYDKKQKTLLYADNNT